MPIALYTKGRTHTVASESDPTTKLDCTIKLVNHNDDRVLLIAQGDHFDSVDDLYAPPKAKKPRTNKGEKSAEVVESEDETESGAAENEDENPAH
jgi:hypothetical protein